MKNRSFLYSLQAAARGVVYAYVHEKNFRREVYMGLLAYVALVILGGARMDYAIITIIVTLVLVCEVTNTAIERAVDIMKPHKHPYARVIKDLSAAFVSISALGALVVGTFIYIPLFWIFFESFRA